MRRVGRFNGSWVQRIETFDHRWMNKQRGFAHVWRPMLLEQVQHIEAHADDRRVAAVSTEEDFVGHLRSALDGQEMHDRLNDQLPTTLCHFDTHKRNLIWDGESDDLVTIDWSYVGRGVFGHELSAPVFLPIFLWCEIAPAEIADFCEMMFEGYVSGVFDTDASISRSQIRLGYLTAVMRSFRFAMIVGLYTLLIGDELPSDFSPDILTSGWRYFCTCENELAEMVR